MANPTAPLKIRDKDKEEEQKKDDKPLSVFDKEKRMSYFAHLDELRRRLVISTIVLVVGAGVMWNFYGPILTLLSSPLPDGMSLNNRIIYGPFINQVKVSIMASIVLVSPYLLYQFFAFLTPALQKKERRTLYLVVTIGTILGSAGIILGYMYIFPIGVTWLLGIGTAANITPLLELGDYTSFTTLFLIGMGIAAETPLFLLGAIRLGVVTPEGLRKNWRYVYLVILLSAAILTPDWSPVTMLAVAGPMLILYHVTMLFARFVFKKKS